MRKVVIPVGVLFFVLLQGTYLVAQRTETEREDIVLPYSVKGRETPFYFAVVNFFEHSYQAYKEDAATFEFNVLSKIQIAPGSEAAAAVGRATLLAQAELVGSIDLRPHVQDPEEYARRQEDFQRKRIQTISNIFNDLLADIREAGGDPLATVRFIEDEIWPGVALHTDNPAFLETSPLIQIIAEEFQIDDIPSGKEM